MKDIDSIIFFTKIKNMCGKKLVLLSDLTISYNLKEFVIYDEDTLRYNFTFMNNYMKIYNGQRFYNISSVQTDLGLWVSLYVNEALSEYKITNN